jgi:uncharacterized iron-regulated protein
MKKFYILILLFSGIIMLQSAKEPLAYKLFDKNGKEVSWADLVSHCEKRDVTFFGELHDNPITHWLQLKLTKDMYGQNKNLTLGAEMFEADQQTIINEYLAGIITEKNFEAEMRLWKNHKTDYKPLLDFAKANGLPLIACNVPRRYASVVAKKGKDELLKISADGRRYICPLPYEVDTTLSGYRNMMQMDMGHGSSINMVYAQAVKDATMAYFISRNLKDNGHFIHYNGAYHSENYQGIIHYLNRYSSKTTVATITTVQQKDASKLDKENTGKADFILVVDEEMTGTH